MPEISASISRSYAAGDDLSLVFSVVDSAGAIVDLTGFTVRFELARRVSSASKAVSTEVSPATATASIDASSPATGQFTITIDKAITAALLGDYYFEAEAQDGSTDESTVTRGYMTFVETLI